MYNIKCTTVTLLECTAQWHEAPSHCYVTITTVRGPEILPSESETLFSLHSSPLPRPGPPGTSCKGNHTRLFICVWLVSLSIMSSRFIPDVACARTSFLCKAEWSSIECIYHILCIHSSIGLFPPCGFIVGNDVLNIRVHSICSSPCFHLFCVIPRKSIVGS